jgi:hypothetical protein
MSSGELQHYVPRLLRRRFADPTSRRVYVYDKLMSNSFPSNPDVSFHSVCPIWS